MKKLFFVFALLITVNSIEAQGFFNKERLANLETFDNKFLTWGYFLGFNSYDFKFDYIDQYSDSNTDIIVEKSPGFNRSEERRVGKSVDLGGRRIIKKKKMNNVS